MLVYVLCVCSALVADMVVDGHYLCSTRWVLTSPIGSLTHISVYSMCCTDRHSVRRRFGVVAGVVVSGCVGCVRRGFPVISTNGLVGAAPPSSCASQLWGRASAFQGEPPCWLALLVSQCTQAHRVNLQSTIHIFCFVGFSVRCVAKQCVNTLQ